jgi:hypothetical protein
MFKRLIVASVLAAALIFTTTASFYAQIRLRPGSYVFTKKDNNIFMMKADKNGHVTDVKMIRIYLTGESPNEKIAANSCAVFFSWEHPGKLSEIYSINPATNWNLRAITHTADIMEINPVIQDGGVYLAFTQISQVTNVATSYLDGSMMRIAAENATAPAWRFALSYTDLATGRIYPWGASGYWHTYLPDGSGLLVQNGQEFDIWPMVGVPRHFATGIRSVALGPYHTNGTNMAVVVNAKGNLEFWTLNALWMPTGKSTAGPGLSGLTFVTWIEVR